MKKVLLLSSLFSIVCIFGIEKRIYNFKDENSVLESLKREIEETESKRRINCEYKDKVEAELLQTDEGKEYAIALLEYNNCDKDCLRLALEAEMLQSEEAKEYEIASLKFMPQNREFRVEEALKKLQLTKKYQEEYLPAITNQDYLGYKCDGLRLMCNYVKNGKFDSREQAMHAAINKMGAGNGWKSKIFLSWISDFNKTRKEEVKKELHKFAHEISEKEKLDNICLKKVYHF